MKTSSLLDGIDPRYAVAASFRFASVCRQLAALSLAFAIVVGIVFGMGNRLSAQIVEWTNANGSPDPFFHADENWNGGVTPNASQRARFLTNRSYAVWWDRTTEVRSPEVGFLDVINGQVVFVNRDTRVQRKLTINGASNGGAFSDFRVTGAGTVLEIRGIHLESLGGGEIIGDGHLIVNGAAPTQSELSILGDIGFDIAGQFDIVNGGRATTRRAYLGRTNGRTGAVTVNGANSFWEILDALELGGDGSGTIDVSNGARVTSGQVTIGEGVGSTGNRVTLSGGATQWTADGFTVGDFGEGTLEIINGAQLSAGGLTAGSQLTSENGTLTQSNGTVLVEDATADFADGIGLGASGHGFLRISGDSEVTARSATLGLANGVADGERYYGTGVLEVDGQQAVLDINERLLVGSAGQATLNVRNGGTVRSGSAVLGNGQFEGAVGTATVDGAGSSWLLAPTGSVHEGDLTIGRSGNGQLTVSNGGRVESESAVVAERSGSTASVWVAGPSVWRNNGDVDIGGTESLGEGGEGLLVISNQGRVEVGGTTRLWSASGLQINGGTLDTHTFDNSRAGQLQLVDGTLRVAGSGGYFDPGTPSFSINGGIKATSAELILDEGATASLPEGLIVGDDNEGHLTVGGGATLTTGDAEIGRLGEAIGAATVQGSGSVWDAANVFVGGSSLAGGGNGTVETKQDGDVVVSGTTHLWAEGTLALRGGNWRTRSLNNSNGGNLQLNDGRLTIDGGPFTPGGSAFQLDGKVAGELPELELTNGATANLISGELYIGLQNAGKLLVNSNSQLDSTSATIGVMSGSRGGVELHGDGTRWMNAETLLVGSSGVGTLDVLAGALFSGDRLVVGGLAGDGSESRLTVDGENSRVSLQSTISIGSFGNGRLEVLGQGTLSSQGSGLGLQTGTGIARVSGDLSQWTTGDLFVGGGGRGELYIEDGGVVISTKGLISVAGVEPYGSGLVRVDGSNARWTNQGALFVGGVESEARGDGTLEIFNGGTASAKGGATIWQRGAVSIDAGSLTVTGTLANEGRIHFGKGGGSVFADSLQNREKGVIFTDELGTSTFLGHVSHNGDAIETAALGTTRFLGNVDGAGGYFGEGLVQFENEFRPGNSPGEILFEGDVEFGTGSELFLELAGFLPGEFDQLDILGDLTLAGALSVSLIDGFELGADQEFLIADVGGEVFGEFFGLGEGAKIADFGQYDLHISYRGRNGNGVRLFTAIPEPGSASLLMLTAPLWALRRRRRNG